MSKGYDLVTDCSISEQLHYQINHILIPSFAKYLYNNKINVITNATPVTIDKGFAVGTGLSSGVDSFHAIYCNSNSNIKSYNITHLTFFNVGSHGDGRDEKTMKMYKKRLNHVKKLAAELNYDLIVVDSNISDIVKVSFVKSHTFRSFSAVLALQKLFKVYYYASGYPLDKFTVSQDSTVAAYDLLNVHGLSTENTSFYSAGIEQSRIEKVSEISHFEPTYKYLNVCTRGERNCGECEKCIRTQLELYSLNKLDLYKDVFDLKKFNKRLYSHMGFMLSRRKQPVYKEIIDQLRENRVKIPFISYFFIIKYILIKILFSKK